MFKQTFHLCAGMLNQLYKVKMEPAGAGMRRAGKNHSAAGMGRIRFANPRHRGFRGEGKKPHGGAQLHRLQPGAFPVI